MRTTITQIKLLRKMKKNQDYSVSELWKMLFNDSGYYFEYQNFETQILEGLAALRIITIDRSCYPYKVRKIRG